MGLMKIRFLLIAATLFILQAAHAADLLEVYEQAQMSDPIFQQAIAQRMATKEGVPITLAALLPNIRGLIRPSVTRTGFSGTNLTPVISSSGEIIYPRNTTIRAYTMALTITQTIFDATRLLAFTQAVAISKGADATLNAALQNLMTRVATAYFNVLKDEDNLRYSEASKRAYAEQLAQMEQQYKVGLKTITDVYTAQASYDLAVATVIAAQSTLTNDRENLRVITGRYYPHLLTLSEDFPLITPQPADIEEWVNIAQAQNWSIKASQYSVEAALQNIKKQFAGHVPTINVQGTVDRFYTLNLNNYLVLLNRNGPGTQTDRQIALNVEIPIFSGGGVIAQTDRATYEYQVEQQRLEQTVRNTLNTARQSYLGILSGVSQINADKQAIKSNISSLEGMEASYRVGTETLYDVLNQQQKVFQAQTQYARDRYAFVNNIFALKQAAGTLSFDDLGAINQWLIERNDTMKIVHPHPRKPPPHVKKKKNKHKSEKTCHPESL